jgi:hypothetical protein
MTDTVAAPQSPSPGLLRMAALPDRLIIVVAEQADPYSTRPATVVKTFALRHTSTVCRIGIRQGAHRAEAVLSAAQMRELADDLYDRADLIDPHGAMADGEELLDRGA